METPEIPLSPSELDEIAPDWVALQRLRQVGLVDEVSQGTRSLPRAAEFLRSGEGLTLKRRLVVHTPKIEAKAN